MTIRTRALRTRPSRLEDRVRRAEHLHWLTRDLESDTAYRLARAVVDTAERRFDRVLDAVGRSAKDVPLADDQEPACVVMRASALEQLGRRDDAASELDGFGARTSGFGRYLVARFLERSGQGT